MFAFAKPNDRRFVAWQVAVVGSGGEPSGHTERGRARGCRFEKIKAQAEISSNAMADAELALILARAPDWYVSDIGKGAGRGRMGAERNRGVAE